jgi:hypothetical protein
MTSPRGTRRAARHAAAVERADESRAHKLQRDLAEARALAPLSADEPECANAPVERLWPRRPALLVINSKSGPNHDSILHVRELVDMLAVIWDPC